FCAERLARAVAHEIRAVHRADRGAQRAETGVLEGLAGREQRLLADHARPLHPLRVAVRVGDDPLTADQLRRLRADVRDANAVGEEVIVLARLAALFHVHALYFDADTEGGGIAHLRRNGTTASPMLGPILLAAVELSTIVVPIHASLAPLLPVLEA